MTLQLHFPLPMRRPPALVAVMVMAAASLLAPPDARADEPLIDWRANLIFEAASERNFKLERGDTENVHEYEPQLRLSATLRRGRPWWAFVETEWVHKIERETGEATERDTVLRLNQAYLAFDDWLPDTRVRVGRWLLRDQREWLFDENFDGVRASFEDKRWRLDGFVGRVNHWQRDLLDSRSRGDPLNFVTLDARYETGKDAYVGAYAVRRHDFSAANDHQTFIGLRSHATPDKGLRHWAELAHVSGRDAGGRINGHALDAGLTWTLADFVWKPRLTLGYAWASGDGDGADGKDRAYRQTGLQSNEATHGGLAKFRVYGEALDPSLSNLQMLTLGLGVQPLARTSVDLVYHHYRQVRIGELRDARLEPRVDDERSRLLGHAVDLVLGWRPQDDVSLELAMGWFRPGERFRGDRDGATRADGAWGGRVEIDFRF